MRARWWRRISSIRCGMAGIQGLVKSTQHSRCPSEKHGQMRHFALQILASLLEHIGAGSGDSVNRRRRGWWGWRRMTTGVANRHSIHRQWRRGGLSSMRTVTMMVPWMWRLILLVHHFRCPWECLMMVGVRWVRHGWQMRRSARCTDAARTTLPFTVSIARTRIHHGWRHRVKVRVGIARGRMGGIALHRRRS